MFRLPKSVRHTLRRRLISGVTLLAYLACAIGFPLPGAAMANACGQQACCCGSAEQCRASGCGCEHGAAAAPAPAEEDVPVCCNKKPAETLSCCTTDQEVTIHAKPVFRWVVGMSAQKCRGDGPSNWVSAEVALPGPVATVWQPNRPYCHSLPVLSAFPFVVASDSLDPPPRCQSV